MYYYIVDTSKVSQRQFERGQSDLYSSISQYHINGEIVRVTGIRTIKQLVETAFFHQAKTIVAVGVDETLNEVINHVGERAITIGYIPLVQTELSEFFGMPNIAIACKNLAVRRVEEIDLGTANGKNFLSKLSFGLDLSSYNKFDILGLGFIRKLFDLPTFRVSFKAENNYNAASDVIGGMIINCQSGNSSGTLGKPTDGLLDVVLLPKLSRAQLFAHKSDILHGQFNKIPGASIFHVANLEIAHPEGLPLKVGETELSTTPAKISIKPKALKIIVGRNRKF